MKISIFLKNTLALFKKPIKQKYETYKIEIFQSGINNYFRNYDHEEDDEFLQKVYQYLLGIKKYKGVEYRFICWLTFINNHTPKKALPFIVKPIATETIRFKEQFLFSLKRNELFEELEDFLKYLKSLTNIQSFKVLIGGSFTDEDNESPNDLDFVILIPPGHEGNSALNEGYLYSSETVPDGIDVRFLPENFDLNRFKSYSNMVCLGNEKEKKDKDKPFKNNSFRERTIFQIEL